MIDEGPAWAPRDLSDGPVASRQGDQYRWYVAAWAAISTSAAACLVRSAQFEYTITIMAITGIIEIKKYIAAQLLVPVAVSLSSAISMWVGPRRWEICAKCEGKKRGPELQKKSQKRERKRRKRK